MTKKTVWITMIFGIMILSVMGVILRLCFGDYLAYVSSKKKVVEYLERTYDFEYSLQYSRIGKNSWPAGRQEDEFIFYDMDNDLYFQIIGGEDEIYDYYEEAYYGKRISSAIQEELPPENFANYMLRCWCSADKFNRQHYENTSGQIVFFTSDPETVFAEAYSMVQYMATHYSGMQLNMIIAGYEYKKSFEDLFQYKKFADVDSIADYNKQLILLNLPFSDTMEFQSYLND